MSIFKRLTTGGALRSLSVVIMASVSLITMPIMIHTLGDKNYGIWSLVSTLIGYCLLTDFGLTRAFNQSLANKYGTHANQEEINTIVSSGVVIFFTIQALVLILTLMVSYSGSFWVEPNDVETFLLVTLIIGITYSIQVPIRIAGEVLYILVRHDLLIMGQLTEYLIRMSLIIYAILNGYGLVAMALITLVTSLCEYGWQSYCAAKNFPVSIRKDNVSFSYIKSLFYNSLVYFVSDSTAYLKTQIIPALVARLISVDAIVFVSVAQRLVAYSNQFITSWTGMLASVFGQMSGDTNTKRIENTLFIMTSFICLCSGYILLSVQLYGKAFIETWLGPAYTISSDLLFYFILTGCVEYCMYPAKEMLYGIAKHKGLAILHTTELLLLIVLSYFLTQEYGLIGFGYASVLAVIPLEIICIPILLNHYLDVHVSKILLPVGKIVMVWVLILYTMYIIIEPNVQSSFSSLIVWNIVQLIILAPCVILLLPDQIRKIVLTKMDKVCKF